MNPIPTNNPNGGFLYYRPDQPNNQRVHEAEFREPQPGEVVEARDPEGVLRLNDYLTAQRNAFMRRNLAVANDQGAVANANVQGAIANAQGFNRTPS